MEVIETLQFKHLNGWGNIFGSIVLFFNWVPVECALQKLQRYLWSKYQMNQLLRLILMWISSWFTLHIPQMMKFLIYCLSCPASPQIKFFSWSWIQDLVLSVLTAHDHRWELESRKTSKSRTSPPSWTTYLPWQTVAISLNSFIWGFIKTVRSEHDLFTALNKDFKAVLLSAWHSVPLSQRFPLA